jgi:predicted permease
MKKAKGSPPALFLRFFRWYCHPKIQDYIEGDLMEVYAVRLKASGKRKADIKFIIDVMLLFRPGIIRSPGRHQNINQYGMYKSYLKIGWRNLVRDKGYSLINIGGLALGMTVATLIGLWIFDELSYNRYHKNHDHIAQVWSGSIEEGTGLIEGGMAVQYPVKSVLASDYSQHFRHVLRAWWPGEYALSRGENKFGKKGQFIDAGIIEMLSLNMLKGNVKSLDKTNTIILSARAAESIFGQEDPMYKMLKIDNTMDVEVTGIYQDLPHNNRFAEFEFFAPLALRESSYKSMQESHTDWDNRSFITFVQIDPATTFESVNAAIRDIYSKHVPSDFFKTMEKDQPFIQLIPMSTWHLYSEFKNGKPAGGRITYVWLFGVAGVFVLLLACINFINLSIARSEKRAREVGIRKAIGSARHQLVVQFLSESFMVVAIAFAISLSMITLLRDSFNDLSDKDIALPFSNPAFWIAAAVFVSVTGFLSGLYPAFYLSSFRPVAVLKGVSRIGHLAMLPRKVLVIVQFSVSIILIVGTLIVYRQIEYAQDRAVGYVRERLIMVLMNDPGFKGKNRVLRNELRNTGVVSEVAASSSPLTAIWNSTGGYEWQGKDPNFDAGFAVCKVTTEFGKTTGWKVVAGRDYSNDFSTDSINSIVINEAAAKYMGMEDPIGKEITDVDEYGRKKWTKTIIGVVKDLITESPYDPVVQTLYLYQKDASSVLNIRLNATVSAQVALPEIKKAIEKVVPTALFDYKFIDEEYARKFGQEQRIGKLSGAFSILAIFISCLGLFGLAAFVAEQRTKEIGIRKVMGASVSNLWQLLIKEFIILVIVSFFIAVPVGYYFMSRWLHQYQYRTEIPAWVFLVTCTGALVIALLTVSFHAIRAASMDPVKSLRSE